MSLGTILIVFSCNDDNADTNAPGNNPITFDCAENTELCTVAESNNQLGFDLVKQLSASAPEENILISPLSISTALSMAVNEAEGNTKTEMLATLHANGLGDLDRWNEIYQLLLTTLPDLDPNVTLRLANSIWYRQEFPIAESFVESNATYYLSDVLSIDFKDPGAKDQINNWVSDQTKGFIPEMIEEVPEDIVMYLINALYFNGGWRNAFEEEATFPSTFTTAAGQEVPVDMMTYGKTELSYFSTDAYHAVDLPYGDSVFSCTLILPKKEQTLAEVYGDIYTQKSWQEWTDAFTWQGVFLVCRGWTSAIVKR